MPSARRGHGVVAIEIKTVELVRANDVPIHRKTCRRMNVPHHAHSLTFSCFGRQPFLDYDLTRRWMIDAIDRARCKLGYDVWAYVLMPEHVHILVRPREAEYDISEFLTALKLPVTRKACAHAKRCAPDLLARMLDRQPNGDEHVRFWQRGGGYDRNIVTNNAAMNEINYIHANPVRRGICEKTVDWLWSSAAEYAGLEPGPLRIDRISWVSAT